MGSTQPDNRRETPFRRFLILDADYRIEYMNDFPRYMSAGVSELTDRLPRILERAVRLLTASWGGRHVLCPERRCIMASGLAMRVFVLTGAPAQRIGVAFESYRVRMEDGLDPVGALTY